jgi:hypothetical protein
MRGIVSLIMLISLLSPLVAFEVGFESDSLKASLGDVIQFNWKVDHQASDSIAYRLDPMDGTGIEILSESLEAGKAQSRILFKTAVYDSVGPFQFPQITIYDYSPQAVDSLVLDGPLLQIYSILTPADSSFRDIKGLQRIPTRFNWWILLWLALAGSLIFLIFKIPRFRKLVVKEEEAPVLIVPPEEAHLVALRELEHLRRSKLLSLHQFKDFHSELTHILKTYLERRYLIDALDLTTYELMLSIAPLSEINEEIQAELKQILETSDLIKFAKAQSNELDSGKALTRVVDIVNKTKIENDMGDDT